jgi:hypothetical protein
MFYTQIVIPMAEDLNKICSVENKSGKDAVILIAVSKGESINQDTIVAGNGRLNQLAVSGNGTLIKNGESGSITLDGSIADATNGNQYLPIYDLIVSDSEWLYPMASLSLAQQGSNGSTGFAAQTITPEARTALDQAAAFYQVITACPGSQLTKDYTRALRRAKIEAIEKADGTAASSAAIAAAVAESINGFFAKTERYKLVTLPAIIAIDNYYNNFPSAWAGFKNSATFYLYSSDGKTGGFAGTLSLVKNGPLDISKPSGGFTCTFTPARAGNLPGSKATDTSKAVSLTYADGLFTDDPKSAKPAIALKGSFMKTNYFTGRENDNSVLIIVAGSINGAVCIGFNPAHSTVKSAALFAATSNPVVDYFDKITHPKTEKQLIIALLTLAFAILLIPAFAFAVYQIYKAVSSRTGGDIIIRRKQIEDALNEDGVLDPGGAYSEANLKAYKLFQNEENAIPGLNLDSVSLFDRRGRYVTDATFLWGGITTHASAVRELLTYRTLLTNENFAALQRIARTMKAAISDLGTAIQLDDDSAGQTFEKEFASYKLYAQEFQGIYEKVSQKLGQDARESISESVEVGARVYEQLASGITIDEEEISETDPKIEEEVLPFK